MRSIETLTYTNELGESLVFSFYSIFCTQKVEGLSNVRSAVYSINSMGQAGDSFVAARIESRDIDIDGVIRERDPDRMRAYRRMLARILNPQLAATLTYSYGDMVRVISCRSVSAPTVSKSPKDVYAKFSVSLVCHNPFWREHAEHMDEIAAWVGGFEFPVEIPALNGGIGGIELGFRLPSLIVDVENDGDVDAGMKLMFSAMEAVKNPSIINVTTGEQIKVNLDMLSGDVLVVSTGYGAKWATLTRDGKDTDALHTIDVSSTFLQLRPGSNKIRYDAEQGLSNLEVTIFHSNLYLGV